MSNETNCDSGGLPSAVGTAFMVPVIAMLAACFIIALNSRMGWFRNPLLTLLGAAVHLAECLER